MHWYLEHQEVDYFVQISIFLYQYRLFTRNIAISTSDIIHTDNIVTYYLIYCLLYLMISVVIVY